MAPPPVDSAFYCRALGCLMPLHDCVDRQTTNRRVLDLLRRRAGAVGTSRRKRGSAPEFVACTFACRQGREVRRALATYVPPWRHLQRSDLADQRAAMRALRRVGLWGEPVPTCDYEPFGDEPLRPPKSRAIAFSDWGRYSTP